MGNYVEDVIRVALAEDGYIEKKSNSQLEDKKANIGDKNYTKYGKDMHDLYPSVMDYPAYWCDAFVDWCFQKAYGVSNAKGLLGGNFDDYTVASAQLYKNKGEYYKKDPKIGDQIFFTNGTRICHTGLVYKVDSTKVYTVEGNTSSGLGVVPNGGAVAKKSYPLTYAKIDGYGRPKYDVKQSVKYVHNGVDYTDVFDPVFYANKYADLKKAFGDNEMPLFKHFLDYGMKEYRQASANFNVVVYMSTYKDLRDAFDQNFPAYYLHYIQFGKAEGRKAI